jgi:hypothetical protein
MWNRFAEIFLSIEQNLLQGFERWVMTVKAASFIMISCVSNKKQRQIMPFPQLNNITFIMISCVSDKSKG